MHYGLLVSINAIDAAVQRDRPVSGLHHGINRDITTWRERPNSEANDHSEGQEPARQSRIHGRSGDCTTRCWSAALDLSLPVPLVGPAFSENSMDEPHRLFDRASHE